MALFLQQAIDMLLDTELSSVWDLYHRAILSFLTALHYFNFK